MTLRNTLIVFAVLLAGYLATSFIGSRDDGDARLTAYPCWFVEPDEWEVRCYRFTVPEARTHANDRRISIPVVVFKPRGRPPVKTPVLHLAGGPGQPAGITDDRGVDIWGYYLASLRWSADRIHVMFDPRGVGPLSSPQLRCAILSNIRWNLALSDLGEGTPAWRKRLETTTAMCRDAFVKAGIDLSAYSTEETAKDIVALRNALGFARWDLYGVSYGTRLGLEIIKQDPSAVRAAILDGMDTPHLPVLADSVPNLARSIDLLTADCAANDACNANFPALKPALKRIVDRVQKNPLTLTLHPSDGRPLDLNVDDQTFLEALEYALFYTDWLPFVPILIRDFDLGKPRLFAHLATTIVDEPYYKSDANALALSVRCGTEVPATSAAAFAQARQAAPWLAAFDHERPLRTQCAAWFPEGPRDLPLPAPVASDVPVLLLSGAYDPRTPPTYAMAQQQSLPNSHHVIIRDQSHGVSVTSDCAQEAMADFLDGPDRFEPPACHADQTPPVFVTEVPAPQPSRADQSLKDD